MHLAVRMSRLFLYSLKKKRELEYMKLVKGAQSIAYDRAPYLISSASVVGKKEGEGPIGEMFDLVGESDLFGENTWEEAESTMQREACLLAMGKAHVSPNIGICSFSTPMLVAIPCLRRSPPNRYRT